MAHDYKQTLTGLLYKSRNCEYATLQKVCLTLRSACKGLQMVHKGSLTLHECSFAHYFMT